MMGQLPAQQNSFFYDFCLERHIPANHLLRRIDQFLDFDRIRQHLQDFYSHTGRPSIDPELMIRMLLVGYCYGIRSERRLCDEVNFNLAYRWFCGLGLEDEVPDHSTFSKNRHGRFREADGLRFTFDTVVQRCIEQGLVKGEGFAIDASFVKADVSKHSSETGPVNWTPASSQSRAVKEYLAALDEGDSLKRSQKRVSLTDPMSQWSAAKGPADFYYSTNTMIDVGCGIIMDVEASPSTNVLEARTTKTMLERVEANHDMLPARLMGDTAYGTAENLGYLVEEKKIAPHIPVWDKSKRDDDTYSQNDFIYIEQEDEYVCPQGHRLHTTGRVTAEKTLLYRSSTKVCGTCPVRRKCSPNTPMRRIKRSVHEKARDVARAISLQDDYINKSRHERKKIEMSYAHMKRHLGFNRLRLRGLAGANDEFLLVATAQNLRKMARYCGQPPPAFGIPAPES
ncbi:transposase [Pseudomonadota bacterium]